MSKEVGRNQPCPCGSGKKYKHCCWGTDVQSGAKKRNTYLMVGALVAVAIVVILIMSDDGSPPALQSNQQGQAPAGKVWSAEHGHYHDAPGTQQPAIPTTTTIPDLQTPGNTAPLNLLSPQQPGSAPPGKVWSAEHGHYHDAPGTAPVTIPAGQGLSTPSQPTPQPPGEAPPGKTWSTEHGHWHDTPKSDSF